MPLAGRRSLDGADSPSFHKYPRTDPRGATKMPIARAISIPLITSNPLLTNLTMFHIHPKTKKAHRETIKIAKRIARLSKQSTLPMKALRFALLHSDRQVLRSVAGRFPSQHSGLTLSADRPYCGPFALQLSLEGSAPIRLTLPASFVAAWVEFCTRLPTIAN